jgi:hypothetical protein
MPRARFEPPIPATKRPQTYALDSVATGIGPKIHYKQHIPKKVIFMAIPITIRDIWTKFSDLHGISTSFWGRGCAEIESKPEESLPDGGVTCLRKARQPLTQWIWEKETIQANTNQTQNYTLQDVG